VGFVPLHLGPTTPLLELVMPGDMLRDHPRWSLACGKASIAA
jgi:hypothetical protein